MVFSPEPPWQELTDRFEIEYDDAVIYGDVDGQTVLHEGPARVRVNGWVELPTGRLLSPSAIHHIDTRPDR